MSKNDYRTKGEGTRSKVSNRNLWHGKVRIGKGKRVSVYAKNRNELKSKMNEALKRANLKAKTTKKETMYEYLKDWYPKGSTKRGALHQKTIDSRLTNINRMNQYIGHLKLSELAGEDIEDMYEDLKHDVSQWGRPLSGHSLRQVHTTLSKALNDAKTKNLILFSPMLNVVNKPTAQAVNIEPLTEDEVKKLLSVPPEQTTSRNAKTSKGKTSFNTSGDWSPLWRLLVETGLRRGEALGLTWKNLVIDGDSPYVKVVQTLVTTIKSDKAPNGLLLNSPKTEMSKRTLEINPSKHPELIQALKNHRAKQNERKLSLGTHWNDNNLVFPNSSGELIHPSVVFRAFKRTVKESGIDRNVRIHDLRHTCGTIMHQNGVDVKQIQETLGHETVQITYDLYITGNRKMVTEAMGTVAQAINS